MTPRGARLSLRFGPFVFDAREPRLWRSDSPVDVTHRALLLLHLLLARAGELVGKDELVAQVWQRAAVSDAAVAKRVQELRAALGDDPRAPSYIETVHGRGLRFIAEVTPASDERTALVGRADALRRLVAELGAAEQSQRRLVLVSGEAGIGKTSLLQWFRNDPALSRALLGQGQCVPQGEGQPYLPVVAAIGELASGEDAEWIAGSLRRFAPSWCALIPMLCGTHESAHGISQQRMLLELATALEWVAAARSVVLLLEDLHWADPSTIALLDFLSRRTTRARLLVVATFRDAAFGAQARPLRQLLAGRLGREGCAEVKLGRLAEPDVRAYLAARFSAPLADSLAPALFARTAGLPLFVSWLANDWVERRALVRDGEAWRLGKSAEAIAAELPDSLQRFFDVQLAAMAPELVGFMETASVIGPSFALEALARLMGENEERVEKLAREVVGSTFLLARTGGSAESRMAIAHELLRDAIYARVPLPRRRALHGAWAELLAEGDGEPAERAVHLRLAGRPAEAALQHFDAARRAAARHAQAEAASHFGAAIELLEPGAEPRVLLLDSLLGRGASLVASHGYAAAEVRDLFERAERLARELDDPRRRFAALNGLHSYYEMRGELVRTKEFEPAMREAASRCDDATIRARVHAQVGERLLYMAEFASARTELELACALCELEEPDPLTYASWTAVAAGAHGNLALVECELGLVDSALRRVARNVAEMTRRAQPYSLGLAHFFGALVRINRREPEECLVHQRALGQVAASHGYADFAVWADTMAAYLAAERSEFERGIDGLRAGLAALDRSGVVITRSGVMTGLVSALLAAGRTQEAREELEQVRVLSERTGEYIRRVQVLCLEASIAAADLERNAATAHECLERAYRLARATGSLFWELRTASGALALARATGIGRAEWRERVASVLAALPEGRDTPDQREARARLEN